MDISVVIVSWNDRRHLEACLESLAPAGASLDMEIVVVDNASTDGSTHMVETKFPAVRLIKKNENLGFAKANNIGIKASTGKYLYLINSDVKVLDDCVKLLADYMNENPRIGILGPKVLNGDMSLQSSCRKAPGLWNNFCSATGLANVFRNSAIFSGEQMTFFKGDRIMDVDVLAGCFWVARRAAIDGFGLLDEKFFMYAEDVDWCMRCRKAGWGVVFFPGASAIHFGGGSSARQGSVWVALTQQRSILRYWQKHHGALGRFLISGLMITHKAVRLSAAMVDYVIRHSEREKCRIRMQVSTACMKDLFIGFARNLSSFGKHMRFGQGSNGTNRY
jgi:GT2 family glycosyltransferase